MAFGPDGCIYTSQAQYGVQNHGHQRRLQLRHHAVVADAGAVADLGIAKSGAGNVANLQCDAPLCDVRSPVTQVVFDVTGANPQDQQVATNASGQASFSYAAAHPGRRYNHGFTTVSSTAAHFESGRCDLGTGFGYYLR